MLSAREGLDDEHRRAAVPAHEGGPIAAMIGAVVAGVSGRTWRPLTQKFASGGDIALAVGVSEQAVVSDTMKSGGQHVQKEATHELLGGHGHADAFADWLMPLRQCEWVIYAKRPIAGPEAMLAYLSRYTRRVAISKTRQPREHESAVR